MRKPTKLAIAVLAAALLLVGCSGGGAQEPAETPLANETEFHGPLDPYQQDAPEPVLMTDFKQPYTFENGLEFRIVKIEAGHITSEQAHKENEYFSKTVVHPGDGIVDLAVQLKNGTGEVWDDYFDASVTYGPNSEPAKTTLQYNDEDSIEFGNILPGRQKTVGDVYWIPAKYWDDVTVEIVASRENSSPTLIYTGSVKP
jgi:hypothetical protein